MCTIVSEYEQVLKNVKQFNFDLQQNTDIVSQLSMFRHWYFIEESGKFGPSKYIGYADISTEKYRRGKGKDGGDTERALARWFRKATEEDISRLPTDLDLLVSGYGKKIRKNFVIHIRK